jgi:hypothetical protein
VAISIDDINATNRDEFGGDYELILTTIDEYGNRHSAKREDSEHLDSLSVLPGDIIFKENPALQFNFRWHTKDKSVNSKREWAYLTMKKGFEPCQYDAFDIRPELQQLWVRTVEGHIALSSDDTTILMFRSAERYAQEKAKELARQASVLNPNLGAGEAINSMTAQLRRDTGTSVESFGKLELETNAPSANRRRK